MSYDFTLVKPQAGQTALEAVEQLSREDAGVPLETPPAMSADDRALQKRAVAALRAHNPAFESFRFDLPLIASELGINLEQAALRFQHVELNGPQGGNGIQVIVAGATVSITVPYWHTGPQAEDVFAEIWVYLQVLAREGFVAYDPQLDRMLDLATDRPAALAIYDSVTRRSKRS
ncbi:MAG TPA: hypothetical protein VKB80_28205 [Kofleriaceae bacterium]|nr:hypothetical protein [Kofleriaceae bacterium]